MIGYPLYYSNAIGRYLIGGGVRRFCPPNSIILSVVVRNWVISRRALQEGSVCDNNLQFAGNIVKMSSPKLKKVCIIGSGNW